MVRGNQTPRPDDADGLVLEPAPAWLSPGDRYDAAAARLLRTAGRMLLAELRGIGISLRLCGKDVMAGPREKLSQEVIARIEKGRAALAAALETEPRVGQTASSPPTAEADGTATSGRRQRPGVTADYRDPGAVTTDGPGVQ